MASATEQTPVRTLAQTRPVFAAADAAHAGTTHCHSSDAQHRARLHLARWLLQPCIKVVGDLRGRHLDSFRTFLSGALISRHVGLAVCSSAHCFAPLALNRARSARRPNDLPPDIASSYGFGYLPFH
ncbi:uncharacterized protein N7477_007179 [Penicillium maclennaniae]|uniref:uncharacterized protein n=1 Tax=Penicillium maclennaniae TaxID=1343394 RepID=UPI0025404D8D|nr:uncharacterized protein N7477_007179 [Penicillium maclennaniae]KAJ5668609.1 hypothetical protein N7477_007179 [Penicillium maclennaniae]